MSKKKVQHKGKPKHATKESEDFVFRKNLTEEKEEEEEYTTVAEFETNKKYSKRLVESNWSKYETSLYDTDFGNEENEIPKTDDFNDLLKSASSDCSHFQFSSEKLWESENISVGSSKVFNLDLNVLSSGLACVPFYERMGLDVNQLSAEDKKLMDEAAENSLRQYNSIREKSSKKPDLDEKNVKTDLHNLEESLNTKLDLGGSSKEKKEKSSAEDDILNTTAKEIVVENENKETKIEKNKQKLFLSETDENLEDWLDSVLDD